MNEDMLLNLYKSVVRSHVEYATQIWSTIYKKKDKMVLENVQRRGTKLVKSITKSYLWRMTSSFGSSYSRISKRKSRMLQVYKIIHCIDRVDKEKLFRMATYTSTRRYSLKLFKPRARLNTRMNFFSLRVVDQWNSLPNNVVMGPSINAFKSRLNSFLKNKSLQVQSCVLPDRLRSRFGLDWRVGHVSHVSKLIHCK